MTGEVTYTGTPTGGTPAIETHRLRRCYGHITAVADLTISVEHGEVFGLVGPNGGGKTSTIRMLTTLLPPTSGTACVAGFDVVRQAMLVRRSIGYVPQMPSEDGSLTGYENLLISAGLYDIPRRQRKERIREALERTGLGEAAGRLAREYSGGMLRRLEIAQATLHRPGVLFLDEPTVGLDPVAREAVWGHVLGLRRDYGATIFMTTHYMDEADHLCDRVAILHCGRVVAMGTPRELKASVRGGDVTLEDVFIHYAGQTAPVAGGVR